MYLAYCRETTVCADALWREIASKHPAHPLDVVFRQGLLTIMKPSGQVYSKLFVRWVGAGVARGSM